MHTSDRYQIDHYLDNLGPSLPLSYVVQYLYIIVQLQHKGCGLDDADYTISTRQRELHRTDQEYICPERFRSSSGGR